MNAIPAYLQQNYDWAYIRPGAVRLFERAWLVDLILWGNYRRLGDAALAALGEALPGRTLQIACVYGDLSLRIAARVPQDGMFEVIDVLPVQLENLRQKLPTEARVRISQQDSTALDMPDACQDRALLFFLMHEQPADARARTLAEALRVVKPGGKVVIVDFARPRWWHPLRYVWLPVLHQIEPFAADLWRGGVKSWLPESPLIAGMERTSYFGGMYQRIVLTRG
ncbi:MAG: rhodoquinone biosynthesis methyltransferase RquA [Acetobacteraceae bacterium]|nr:rhodoquinone biosynthesis methyltransferase RquA [Acetobacteraceae bacterium]